MDNNIDDIDKTILKSFLVDARVSIQNIAEQVSISGVAVKQRVNKLQQAGAFKGTSYILDPKFFGYKTVAFVGICLEKSLSFEKIISKLKLIPNIIECHYTTGGYSLFIKIICEDNLSLMQILNKEIQNLDGVNSTETIISFDQQIDRPFIPFE